MPECFNCKHSIPCKEHWSEYSYDLAFSRDKEAFYLKEKCTALETENAELRKQLTGLALDWERISYPNDGWSGDPKGTQWKTFNDGISQGFRLAVEMLNDSRGGLWNPELAEMLMEHGQVTGILSNEMKEGE